MMEEQQPIQPGDSFKLWDLMSLDDWDLGRVDRCVQRGLAEVVRRKGIPWVRFF